MMRWRAIYKDGSILPQYCKCGFPMQYPDIDRTKLVAFDIYNVDENEKYTQHTIDTGKLVFRMFVEEGQRLIYRRRTFKDVNINTHETFNERFVYLVGWQQKVNGKNIQSINYVFPDGSIQQAGKWVGGEPSIKDYEV